MATTNVSYPMTMNRDISLSRYYSNSNSNKSQYVRAIKVKKHHNHFYLVVLWGLVHAKKKAKDALRAAEDKHKHTNFSENA